MSKRGTSLSPETLAALQAALDETGGVAHAAHRLLKQQGVSVGLSTVKRYACRWRDAHTTDTAAQARLAALKSELDALRAERNNLLRELGKALEFSDRIAAAVRPLAPLKRRRRETYARHKQQTPRAAVLLLSDWHIGEVIEPEELLGVNAYNYRIAKERLHLLAGKVQDWLDIESAGHYIESLHIVLLGDFISGDIHRELSVTNEFPAPVQVVKAAELIAELVHFFAEEQDVVVHGVVADNHSRLTARPHHKQKSFNSLNYLVYRLAEAYLARDIDAELVSFNIYPSPKAQFAIAGVEVLADHGDQIRAYLGLPWYGMMREEGREARKRMQLPDKLRPYAEHLRGHWHVAAVGPFGIINGSLCGTTEYDAAVGRFAPPSQVSFLLHPRHGIFNWCRWNLTLTTPTSAPKHRKRKDRKR